MVDAAATMALETLRDLLVGEVKLLSSVEGQVEDVERDLRNMRNFLKDADKWQDKSATVTGWVSELMALATRAEEVLERYALEITSKRGAKNLKQRLKRFPGMLVGPFALHEIGKEITGILSRMAQLTQKLESIRENVEGRSSAGSKCNEDQRLLRQTYGHEIENHFVGMKKDIDLLISRMKNDDSSCRVISICGMGGLGKTTLATKIYQDKDIRLCFEARAWVCITQKLQAKAIFQEILRQLLPGENSEGEEVELVRKLYKTQKVKKCLVVLDDIWDCDHWNILKNAFPHAKILLTTRNQMIADTEFVHKLDLLTEDESWDLLQKIALPFHQSQDTDIMSPMDKLTKNQDENGDQLLQKISLPILESEGLTIAKSKQFEATGRELVRKCGCLPLAVSVIGGVLRGKHCLGDWKKVLESMESRLKYGEGVNANDKRVEQVLNLSYNVLPYYLKLCFLYLGCFPEDEDICVEDVYLIWMAEGLISSDDKGRNETLRNVAERYLNELASRCMVHVKLGIDAYTGESFKSCRLHVLVRDLCLSKGKKDKFFEDSERKFRRLAINSVDDEACSSIVAESNNVKHLRSFLFLRNKHREFHDITDIWQKLFSNALLRSLRVLVLEYCRFKDKKLPDAVRKLVMLKHLSLRHSWDVVIEEFVCKLPCLQSLDLRAHHITLPNSIDWMGQLRHLFLDQRTIKNIDDWRLRLDGLTKLETLIGFNSKFSQTKHDDLLQLTNLRRFDGCVHDTKSLSVVVGLITKLKNRLREASLEIYVSDLSSKECAKHIDLLMHNTVNSLKIDGKLSRLPTWGSQLPHNLNALILVHSTIEEDPMETLQQLPMLRSLWLSSKSFSGTEMVCGSKGFPQLKNLKLELLRNLEGCRVEQGAMPNLSDLTIIHCEKLKKIPQGINFLTSITKLSITKMPINFMERLREEGEDYPKISHIPFIHLGEPIASSKLHI